MDSNLRRTRIEMLMLFALYLLILPRVYMDYDMGFWRQWALSIHHTGLAHAYDSTINYFPVYVYGLYVYDLLQGTEANISHNINNIKLFFVFFDFLPLFVLCCFRQRILSFRIPYLYLLLNIAYVFNSMVWGQIDSIYTNLAFLAIVACVCYPVAGILLYVAALNTKQQAVEFLPVMIMVLLYSVRKVKTAGIMAGGVITLQALLLLPFILSGSIGKLVSIVTHTVGLYHNVSICAFNVWYLLARGNPYFINDSDTWLVISYRVAGFIMFAASGTLVLAPLAKRIWQLRKNNLAFDEYTYRLLFLSTGLLCLCFFYFNTQMHERYVHPIIIFFFFYGVASRNYRLYILASIPYFLSLDKCFASPGGFLPIVHYKIIYASQIITLWYTVTIIYGSYLLYKLNRKQFTAAGELPMVKHLN